MTTLYPYYRVSPESLHASALLNHLAAPLPAFARVLEMGCGSATRLIMHAWAYPESIAIGVDIDEEAIQKGQQHAAELGCQNVELFAAGLGSYWLPIPANLITSLFTRPLPFWGKASGKPC